MPRILHVSDTHLGMQAYGRLTPEGLNQREVDAQAAFGRCVDAALTRPPDLFLHTGDLFDHPRPNNRAIAFALQQVRRLSDARIATVLVSGNHDAPRMKETGSIFRIFDGLPGVHPVYGGAAERIEAGGLVIHAVPQGITQEAFQKELASVTPRGPGPHVLAVHGTVLGVEGLFTSEFNEYQIPSGALRPDFDYIALGHFHNARAVAPNAWYAGSTEFGSFNEAGQDKGWLDVDVREGRMEATHRSSQARPMVDLGTFDAGASTAAEVASRVRDGVRSAPPGAIARFTVERLPRSVARTVDWPSLRDERPDLAHFEIRTRLLDEASPSDGGVELGPLGHELDRFLERYPLPPKADRARLRGEAARLLGSQGEEARAA